MKIVKSIILYGGLIVSSALLWNIQTSTLCDDIRQYSIGVFDERFRIEESEFLELVAQAEDFWESAAGKELFEYETGAEFKINLVWSEEQERLYEGKDLAEELDTHQHDIGSVQSRYEAAVQRYETALTSYEKRLKEYEEEVDYWNEQGGAPEDDYEALRREAIELEAEARRIEQLRSDVNTIASENNNLVENYNDGVQSYNEIFSEEREFDAGNTNGNEINIYSYDGNDELLVLLIHEFGHVLGIEHSDDPESVMYYLLNEDNSEPTLTPHDIETLQATCRLS